MSRFDSLSWRRATAWGATLLATWLLFWPFAPDNGVRGIPEKDKMAHVVIFAGLAWAWGRVLWMDAIPSLWRRLRLGAVLALLTLVVEFVQPFAGRGFDLRDAAAGSIGALLAAVAFPLPFTGLAALVVLAALPWCIPGTIRLVREYRAFPVLAAAGPDCWTDDWEFAGLDAAPSPEGLRLVPAAMSPDSPVAAEPWPGLFRVPVRRDWSAFGDWRFRLYWDAPAAALFVVRLDDRREPQPAYAERFQTEWRVLPGQWNELVIPRAEWSRTSGGGSLDASEIARWGLFLNEPVPFESFTLGEAVLSPLEEKP